MKGASTVNWTSYMGGPRSDIAYPRAMENALRAAGRPAEVRDMSLGGELASTALKHWEPQVARWSPDVIVLHYGHTETLHLLLPQRLERHANSLRGRPGAIRDWYRKRVLRPGWKSLAVLQQRLDRGVVPATFRHRERRVANDLERLVQRAQLVGSPLVLLMKLVEPGPPFLNWFPGIRERTDAMNDALADVVGRVDRDNVRLVDTPTVLRALRESGVAINPDGGHFAPAAHAAVGSALASEVLSWADGQPHLRT